MRTHVVPILIYMVAGRALLGLFGADYADNGWLLLVLLTVAALPDAITNVAVGVLRSTDRITAAVWLNGSMLLGCLVLSFVLLPSWGIVAVGASWLAAQTAGALWAAFALRRIGSDHVQVKR